MELLQKRLAEGKPAPALDHRPDLFPDLQPVWEGFTLLSPSRNVGMSVGAIPLTEIKAYCEMYDIEGEEREEFLLLIRSLDDEYLRWVNEKNKSTSKSSKR